MLIERVHLDFVRAGAKFDSEAQNKYGKIMENLATLTTKFSQVSPVKIGAYEVLSRRLQRSLKSIFFLTSFQNILEDESLFTIDLKLSDMTGLPDSVIATAKETAVERKKEEGTYLSGG